jgi:hypothetical protein
VRASNNSTRALTSAHARIAIFEVDFKTGIFT